MNLSLHPMILTEELHKSYGQVWMNHTKIVVITKCGVQILKILHIWIASKI